MEAALLQTFIYLIAGVISVPIAKRLGLGSVLGYLAAGVIIGPVLGLAGDAASLQNVAQLGVVMMLFIIGLELEPKKLWEMRDRLVGLGGLQMALTTAVIGGALLAMGMSWQEALALGLILALSSTAIVLQTLGEKGWMQTDGGRSSFAVLLFQDIAVIAIFAVLPLLAVGGAGHGDAHAPSGGHGPTGIIATLPAWAQGLATVGAIATVVLLGRFLTRPAFRFIASANLSEIFTAAALLMVVGIAWLMTLVGLSPALGAFVAGVVLADSEFRHELESDIDPFKGLLMGLFFVTVGAGVSFAVLQQHPWLIIGLSLALVAAKAVVLLALGRFFRMAARNTLMLGLGLAQTGEFAFVLLGSARGSVLSEDVTAIASLVVAISMLLTPALFLLFERVLAPLAERKAGGREEDTIDETGPAIIAGVGRFGQIVNRMLVSQGLKTVVIDHDSEMVDAIARFEQKAFYGDGARPELLRAAGIDQAKLFVVAIDAKEQAVRAVEYVKQRHPHVHVIARAFDRVHYYELRQAGADTVIREMFGSSLQAAQQALVVLGVDPAVAERAAGVFRQHDEETIEELYNFWSKDEDLMENPTYVEKAKQRIQMFHDAMQLDREALEERKDGTNS
jgi:monovalent cation:proton antiporter-2 (CPA2) family protein